MLRFRTALTIQIVLSTVIALALLLLMPRHASGFIAGCLLTTVNFVGLGFIWGLVFGKKSVATLFIVIVIKYAILIGVLYLAMDRFQDSLGAFSLGLVSILGTAVLMGVLSLLKDSREQES